MTESGIDFDESLSDTSTTNSINDVVARMSTSDSVNVAPTRVNPASGPALVDAAAVMPPTNNAALALVNPAVAGPATQVQAMATQQPSTSALARWYVITVGCVTGVFQGWCILQHLLIYDFDVLPRHNVHVHVVSVPGACFAHYSSLTSAQAAYGQALNDGTVTQVLL
ncbi:uncharacterized protein EDB91DRAFT_1248437 [Suillus paluster]|uniref:uncharacterized protein n=1 Tax=Suillus paluster TaxID=48578 RepID=UPI001B875686|nr:uncharacterized protein EDB91DRAFT_1248437 [Suillus paluster]KAG1740109.1 hypothetical protein EDB91DRAFT_1248437 [Suillus paluster]